ncbi:MAG: response regulator [Verrucomicrobia bacterium]|nr:response regulator [Verrucomicrobiota bacterium]
MASQVASRTNTRTHCEIEESLGGTAVALQARPVFLLAPERFEARQAEQATPVGLRVLVVDDNVDAAHTLAMLVQLAGHDVRIAYDGPPALMLAQAFQPQVVLLDLNLPAMDGYEVARKLRERPETQEAVLAAVSGWGQPEDRRRSKEAGFDRHFVKPVDPNIITKLLSDARRGRNGLPPASFFDRH